VQRNKPSSLSEKPSQHPLRCAIYTRKSTEEGLEQDFNSLDAQREAAEAFIRSQRREGWIAVGESYDDGGFSGATMERPALTRLLRAAEAGKVDCVVVYKVDRLSRSLLDFTRILSLFEKHNVSFVAVTQQFNTSTSLGRLTLNILLSFAQFERELIGERTRDKMAAAKKKGKWVGGYPVLGYDVSPEGGRLIVNDGEAERVRAIFNLFGERRTLQMTLDAVHELGWRLKSWTGKTGRSHGGGMFTSDALKRLLMNPLYRGEVRYRGECYPGEHAAIVDPAVWDRVQTGIAGKGAVAVRPRNKHLALLNGILVCESCAARMVYSHSVKNGVRYFYYVCLNAQRNGWASCPAKSLPARAIEESIVGRLRQERGGPFETAEWDRMDRARQGETLRAAVESIGYDAIGGRISIRFREGAEARP
jgi:site-specific DNA recombinase